MFPLIAVQFSFILLFCNSYVLCVFQLEELKLVNYEVDILKTPVKVGEEQLHPMLHVKSKYGQEYQCLLPHVEEPDSAEKKESSGDENLDIKELLKPIQSGICLLKTKGWWTYEFCSGQFIKQYHIEDGKILGQVLTLGLYQSDYDWNNETNENKFRHDKQRYHSQSYTNGTRCDLTGLPRSAEVRFYCEEDAGDYIFRVDEPGTCTYVLTVHTARICSHPRLKPLPSNKAHVVSCSPLLNEEQYSQYLQKVDEEKSVAEKKRSKWLTNQQERLKIMKSWAKDDVDTENDNFENLQILDQSDSAFPDENSAIDEVKQTSNTGKPKILTSSTEINEENIENVLWKEYDQEIEKLKAVVPPERFSAIKGDIKKHIDTIISEAGEELDDSLDRESKEAVFSKLTSTLNVFIDKLNKAEKDVVKATQQFKKVQSMITGKPQGDQDSKTDGNEETLLGNLQNKGRDQSAFLEDDKLHVRIRRLDRKSPDASGELHEMDFAQRKQLEQAVKEKLEKSGLDTGGRRIEVKIITAGYYDNEDGKDFHSLSDEETSQFQNMIMALLTGQQEAIQEMERHKKLEENYKFVWNNNEQSTAEDEE